MRPSFLGLATSGFLILAAALLALMRSASLASISLILLFSIAISAHSLQHAAEEVY